MEKENYDPKQNLRNCTIVTQLVNPINPSEKYITSDIQAVIDAHIDQIKAYAWIIHDRDLVQKKDIEYYRERSGQLDPSDPLKAYYDGLMIGSKKPAHVHILLNFKNGKKREDIAKWFDCNPNVIRGSILDTSGQRLNSTAAIYILHVTDASKVKYDMSEIHCDINMMNELKAELDKYELNQKIKNSKTVDEILFEMDQGKTLAEVYDDPDVAPPVYIKNEKAFMAAERNYRLRKAKLPEYLLNIFIEGESGTGKTSIAKILARYLYPDERNPYFSVGAKSVALQNYAGEKVILWNDVTVDKMHAVAPTGDIQDLLDPHQQEKTARNIKNSFVVLSNEVNIFTTTKPHDEFFKGLITDDTPVVQIYRRIPIIIRVETNNVLMYINRGEWFGRPEEWTVYDKIPIAKVNLAEVMKSVPEDRLKDVLGGVLDYIGNIIDKLKQKGVERNRTTESKIYEVMQTISLADPNNEDYITEADFSAIKSHHDSSLQTLKKHVEEDEYWNQMAEDYKWRIVELPEDY